MQISLQSAFSFTWLEFTQWNNSLWAKNSLSTANNSQLSAQHCLFSTLALHIELLFVSVSNIQWRVIRWIGHQKLSALLNISGISQLTVLNQIKSNHSGKRCWQKETMTCRNNFGFWRGALKQKSSDIWYKTKTKLYKMTIFDIVLITFSCLFIRIL